MRNVLTTWVFLLGIVASAEAARLAAGPVRMVNGHNLDCTVANVSDTATVTVSISAVVVGDDTAVAGPVALPPGEVTASVNTVNIDQTLAYCLFDVQGSKKAFRATACDLGPDRACVSAR